MTWIVGRTLPFGYAAAVSDIRVTTPNGYKDCLQKVYEVGPFMALGFAGSALIGFRMVETLQNLLAVAQPDEAWEPEVVAQWWPEDAKEVFEQYAQVVDDPVCEMMLLSAHPTQDTGNPNWPRCYVHRFRSPYFEPELAEPDGVFPGGSKAVAIGCGDESSRYCEVLDHATDYNPGTHGSVMQGEFTSRLLFEVRSTVVNYPTPDVSPFLQLCTVNRLYVRIIDANGKRYGAEGDVTDFTVPKLAKNLVELDRELQDLGGSANARC
jgi:hypothetical protein